jgi:hypothetical protein
LGWRQVFLADVDSVATRHGYEGYAVVQDETAVGRWENDAQERCPLQHYLVRCLLIAVLEKTDAGLAQFTGKALNGKPGPVE